MNEGLFLLIIILTIILVFVCSAGIVGGFVYFNYHHDEGEKTTWKLFAQSNKLELVRARAFGEGAHIVGGFQNYRVKIDTLNVDYQTHTRITLSFANLVNSLCSSSKEIYATETQLNDLFCMDTLQVLKGQIMVKVNESEIYYDQLGVEKDIEYLQSILDALPDLVHAQSVILSSNTPVEAIIADRNGELWPLTAQSLKEIAQDTFTQLRDKAPNLLCPNCLTRFHRNQVKLTSGKSINYYGCRECGQNHEFFEGKVVAVLNSETTVKQDEQDGVLRVNWSLDKMLFDFDEVEIIQATDEEVERFAVQVGNDTDFFRQPKYSNMYCQISSNCEISDSSIRILNRMFERVDYGHMLNISKKSG